MAPFSPSSLPSSLHTRNRSHLDLDIFALEPPNPFQKILLALSASHKAHNDESSQHIVNCDAKRLYETGEGKARAGIDEVVVLEIFSKRSVAQLKLTFSSYRHIYGHSYTSFLKKVDCGAVGDAVRSAAKCICNPPRYYAEVEQMANSVHLLPPLLSSLVADLRHLAAALSLPIYTLITTSARFFSLVTSLSHLRRRENADRRNRNS